LAELFDKLKSLERTLDQMKTTIEENDSELKVKRCYMRPRDKHLADENEL